MKYSILIVGVSIFGEGLNYMPDTELSTLRIMFYPFVNCINLIFLNKLLQKKIEWVENNFLVMYHMSFIDDGRN
jgi:predicted membrane channel-forming protein YqfA (hemolysin III family)